MHFDDAADDEVADFGDVARAQGGDGEELVGAGEGAGEGGADRVRGWGGEVRAVAAVKRKAVSEGFLWSVVGDGEGLELAVKKEGRGGRTASIVGRP